MLQQVPHIKQTMKYENINFPSKMNFSNETRAKQLTDYFRKLVYQESIINNGHFQLEINFHPQNPNVWDNVYKKYNQNPSTQDQQQQQLQQLKESATSLTQNQTAEKSEPPLHVHAQEHGDDQSEIHFYLLKEEDKNEIKNAEAAEMEMKNVKSKPSTINESEMSESKNDDGMKKKQSDDHKMNNRLIIPDHLSFKVQNGIENSCKITKMYRKRDMFICLLNSEKNCIKSFLGHKCIVLTYLSKFKNPINVENHESKYDVNLEIEADILEHINLKRDQTVHYSGIWRFSSRL